LQPTPKPRTYLDEAMEFVIRLWVELAMGWFYCGWLRKPAHETLSISCDYNGINHLQTGAGFLPSAACSFPIPLKLEHFMG